MLTRILHFHKKLEHRNIPNYYRPQYFFLQLLYKEVYIGAVLECKVTLWWEDKILDRHSDMLLCTNPYNLIWKGQI